MSYQLVIAEKPSVARSIAGVIGATEKHDGYLQSIVNIFLQVGMWATPVLWNINDFPMKLQMIVKINPLVYIVEGYRSAVYGKQWFWEDFYSTVYFWIITVVLFGIGALIFKKLKIHFADIM